MADESLPPTKTKSRTGLKLAVGGGLLLLIAAWAVYSLFVGIQPSSQHRIAAFALRFLASAEEEFRAQDRDGNGSRDYWVGDVSRLFYLESKGAPIHLIDFSIASADAAPAGPLPEAGARRGYLFEAVKLDANGKPYDEGKGRNAWAFAFCAYPREYHGATFFGGDGAATRYTFIVNEATVVWRKDLKGASIGQWPKDPAGEGWSKLD